MVNSAAHFVRHGPRSRTPRRRARRTRHRSLGRVRLSPRPVQVASYYPKQNPMMRHPLVRRHLHDEWADEVETKSKMGKGPPKKGQGKRASRKK